MPSYSAFGSLDEKQNNYQKLNSISSLRFFPNTTTTNAYTNTTWGSTLASPTFPSGTT